jgi:hypothetical protein
LLNYLDGYQFHKIESLNCIFWSQLITELLKQGCLKFSPLKAMYLPVITIYNPVLYEELKYFSPRSN